MKNNIDEIIIKGIPGKTPQKGVDYFDGKDGLNGKDGVDGKQGIKGDKGDKGDVGNSGKDGIKGKDGKNGIKGKDGKNGKDGSPDTPKQVKEKLLKVGLDYNELNNTPDINKVINIAVAGVKQASKTTSLVELDDVDYAGLTYTNGKYVLGSGGGGGGTWGSITGTLSDQTDLQTVLDTKVDETTTLTINGTAYDLSANRSWSVGTVTDVAALTLGTTGTDLSSSVATGTTTPVITLNVPTASASNRGALSSTDWSTFNNKFTLPSLTAGSVLFSNGTTIAQDNANFFWDDTNNRLGIGTATPSEAIHLYVPSGDRKILSEVAGGATTAFILKGSSTYWNFAMNSAFHSGNLLITNDNTFTTNAIEISTTNRVGIGVAAPSARLHLPAGTATASTAPLKFTSGTNLTTAEAGAMEYNGTSLMFTPSSAIRNGLIMGETTNNNVFSQYLKGATAFTSGIENTLVGSGAGAALTSGSDNVLLGYVAGNTLTNGNNNQFIGAGAGLAVGAGTVYSTLIGTGAGRGSAILDQVTFIGWLAGYSTNASYSQFIGSAAGYTATNAQYSVFMGHGAGYTASSADHSVFLGGGAGDHATSAAYSEFIGYRAGYYATSASHGFFGGYQAGYGATGANNSVFIGQTAGRNATGAVESIFIGKGSGYNAVSTGVTGDYNIGFGTDTLKAITTGAGNIALGYKVGDTATTGSKNVGIGYDIDYQSNTADGQLTIQNAIFGTGNTGTGTTASTGKIGIYTVAPTCALDVTGGIATSRTAVTAPATTDGNIFSGTYTPSLTGVNNVASSTAYVCQYMRVGNVVTVSGKIEVTPTVNNAQTTIGVSLPIASNFANSQECGGTAHTVANTVLGHGAVIYGDATNDRAEMDYYETHGASDTFSFSFTYQII